MIILIITFYNLKILISQIVTLINIKNINAINKNKIVCFNKKIIIIVLVYSKMNLREKTIKKQIFKTNNKAWVL